LELSEKQRRRCWIEVACPIEFASTPALPLDPYVVGALIGDGGLTGDAVILSSADRHVLNRVESTIGEWYQVRHIANYDYRLTGKVPYQKIPQKHRLSHILKMLGLMGKYSH
jgi:replicative DNA helicase